MKVPSVLIVADDPISASTLRGALRATRTFDVFDGYVSGVSPCGETIQLYRPDVVLVDELRSRSSALDRIVEARQATGVHKVIAMATSLTEAWADALARAGADAAIQKTHALGPLMRSLGDIVAGRVYHAFAAPALRPPLRQSSSRSQALTERELEILRLVAIGAPNGRIAAQLWITEQTVKFHLSNVFKKLGVANRTEASLHAYMHGLLDATPRAEVASDIAA